MSLVPMPIRKQKSMKLGDSYVALIPTPSWSRDWWIEKEYEVGSKSSISHRRSPDGKYREGGPFYTVRMGRKCTPSGKYTVHQINRSSYTYKGMYGVNWSQVGDFLNYSSMSMYNETTEQCTADMFVYGSEAYAKLRPDRPDFAPLVSLAELARELPGIWDSFKSFNERYQAELRRKRKARIFLNKAGKYHLAIQFGLMPIISDVQNWWKAYESSAKRLNQLLRDNGKWVRRRAVLYGNGDMKSNPPVNMGAIVHSTKNHPYIVPTVHIDTYVSGTFAVTEKFRRTYHRVWAVGKSRYYLPSFYFDPYLHKSLRRKLDFNLEVTWSAIYNLIPWSWLFDYFTSLGNLFEALSGGLADRCIFQYAYIMREEVDWEEWRLTQSVYAGPTTSSATRVLCSIEREGIKRSRLSASLFGFGVTHESLNYTQMGILGALGLSKL